MIVRPTTFIEKAWRSTGPITNASPATATRDLADMVAKGAITRTGERRHARYQANVELRPVARVVIDEQGHLVDA